MKFFCAFAFFLPAFGLKTAELLPECSGTELLPGKADSWTCDKFSDRPSCTKHYQKSSTGHFQCVAREANNDLVNCLTGHMCKPTAGTSATPSVPLTAVGQGFCADGQIYGSHAWELAPSSGGTKGFDSEVYQGWVQKAWQKCLAKDANTKFVSVWTDAGYRCYTSTSCTRTHVDHPTKSWTPFVSMTAVGQGFCADGQIYGSHAWELAPSSGGTKGFDSEVYQGWVQKAWQKCLAKDANTKFVSVWIDAGYRCYTSASCTRLHVDHPTKSWTPFVSMTAVGQGFCADGQIYASHAWELAPSSGGTKGFDSKVYQGWVQKAWSKCLAKDANTKFVSVWIDAGYRCYTSASCTRTHVDHPTKSWTPLVPMSAVGQGFCADGQIYASHAWELAPSSGGTKGFDSEVYQGWVQKAWSKCLAKDANTKFVSVWIDAGYRCYTSASCTRTHVDHPTKSWTPLVPMSAVGQGFCADGQIYASHAWELAPSSGGTKGFDSEVYQGWVQKAWQKCLAKDANTKFVSVWTDAGYRCYTSAFCTRTHVDHPTKSWRPASR